MQSFRGVVQKGRGRGRELGYPTANIALTGSEVSGVYTARVYIKDASPYMAAAFADPTRGVLEAHLLDFNDDLYGLEVKVELLEKIRDSAQYDDDEALQAAIQDDVMKVRKYFHDNK
jgi:FAD synthase